jgi:hypothetical protein
VRDFSLQDDRVNASQPRIRSEPPRFMRVQSGQDHNRPIRRHLGLISTRSHEPQEKIKSVLLLSYCWSGVSSMFIRRNNLLILTTVLTIQIDKDPSFQTLLFTD